MRRQEPASPPRRQEPFPDGTGQNTLTYLVTPIKYNLFKIACPLCAVRNPFLTERRKNKMRSRQRNIFEKYGDIFFVTSTVAGHINLFSDKSLCKIFMENLEYYQTRGDYRIIAYILMPDHFHLVLRVNPDHLISKCVGNLKRITSRKISEYLFRNNRVRQLDRLQKAVRLESTNDSRIWKYRFDSLVINNEYILRQKIDYVHNNPVRRGLVENACDWPYSSASNYDKTKNGIIFVETDWEYLID